MKRAYVFKLKSVCKLTKTVLQNYVSLFIQTAALYSVHVSVSVLTHAVFQRKRGSENGSELLWVSGQNDLTRLCIEKPLVPRITKIHKHIKTSSIQVRKTHCHLFSVPANGTKHSVSTACPASSTNTWVKWPAGMFPVTSLQRLERTYMVANLLPQKFTCRIVFFWGGGLQRI